MSTLSIFMIKKDRNSYTSTRKLNSRPYPSTSQAARRINLRRCVSRGANDVRPSEEFYPTIHNQFRDLVVTNSREGTRPKKYKQPSKEEGLMTSMSTGLGPMGSSAKQLHTVHHNEWLSTKQSIGSLGYSSNPRSYAQKCAKQRLFQKMESSEQEHFRQLCRMLRIIL